MNKLIVKAQTALWQFKKNQEGAALVEYSILIGLIAAAVILSVTAIGVWITGRWTALETALGA